MNKQKLKYILPLGIISISILLAVIIIMVKPDIEQEAQEVKALQVQVISAVKKRSPNGSKITGNGSGQN